MKQKNTAILGYKNFKSQGKNYAIPIILCEKRKEEIKQKQKIKK